MRFYFFPCKSSNLDRFPWKMFLYSNIFCMIYCTFISLCFMRTIITSMRIYIMCFQCCISTTTSISLKCRFSIIRSKSWIWQFSCKLQIWLYFLFPFFNNLSIIFIVLIQFLLLTGKNLYFRCLWGAKWLLWKTSF